MRLHVKRIAVVCTYLFALVATVLAMAWAQTPVDQTRPDEVVRAYIGLLYAGRYGAAVIRGPAGGFAKNYDLTKWEHRTTGILAGNGRLGHILATATTTIQRMRLQGIWPERVRWRRCAASGGGT